MVNGKKKGLWCLLWKIHHNQLSITRKGVAKWREEINYFLIARRAFIYKELMTHLLSGKKEKKELSYSNQ